MKVRDIHTMFKKSPNVSSGRNIISPKYKLMSKDQSNDSLTLSDTKS